MAASSRKVIDLNDASHGLLFGEDATSQHSKYSKPFNSQRIIVQRGMTVLNNICCNLNAVRLSYR